MEKHTETTDNIAVQNGNDTPKLHPYLHIQKEHKKTSAPFAPLDILKPISITESFSILINCKTMVLQPRALSTINDL